ncbi:hypothetical protein DFJ58DRAFT_734097 [Suillus subalutaceus]|uniref:uncharacterized protein n=1 Tax=Suillus subalutaceus TaxID=48586 RepID=UPI001B870860|nr:uncharacterized protein DFJ58DRAFT_734097 [Suillus subalutaceus]KAG1837909.1 hypothetical protein DFJ58DRAFT_734097 [Suillus subalutaceus]
MVHGAPSLLRPTITPNALAFSPPASNYSMLSDGCRPSELRTISVNFEAQGAADASVTYGLELECNLHFAGYRSAADGTFLTPSMLYR